MRLIGSKPGGGFKLSTFNNDDIPPYAILSHTWSEGEEVVHDELVAGKGKNRAGYAKLRFCGERAAKDGLNYFWVDTCCIDKRDNVELSTALNSMFRWYQRAIKCYVYLSDVHVPDEVTDAQAFRITWEDAFRRSRWFHRGWTLQELLAPASVEFFSVNGKQLGSKITLEQEINDITQIPISALRNYDLREFTVDERMSWVTGRKTTVKEDRAYCLLGIFGVFLPLIYGEGEEHALRRLKVEIQRDSGTLQSSYVADTQRIPGMFFCSYGSDAGLNLAHSVQPLSYYHFHEMNFSSGAKTTSGPSKNSFVHQTYIGECLSVGWEAAVRRRWFSNSHIR
jgi:hypothetical protein